jgi:uncharacterized protein
MSTGLVCDTSGLLAGFDRKHPAHGAVAALLRTEPGPLLISPLVLTEVDYLLTDRYGIAAATRFYADLRAGAYELAELSRADLLTIVEVATQYADMGLGLADASNVVVAARHATVRLLCLDERHMRAVRPLGHGAAFTLLPADNG